MDLQSVYEVPTKFYLGKAYDLAARQLKDELTMYDSKDLTTHALCVGMTGSGKTGLCLSLLEEAAIDGIPVICVDPKGDLGNLLLTFPQLRGEDFAPWVDPTEAAQKNKTPAELGESYANLWKKGLADWGQPAERIAKFRDSTDITVYTPGSNIGVPLTVLKSFDAPSADAIADGETFREKITSAASGLLTLLGIEADPLTSREHILLSKVLETAWTAGKNLSLADIIRNIQVPPIDRVGVIDLESFFPAAQRSAFAMSLNNLLASPAFAGWLQGEALNIKKMLYTDEGKPRTSIISIAHLSDTERMFFVTILLGELLAWMRSQPGTGSLRAIFYMDEVYGYFPPSAKPPSKPPMLTLLKQARAFGLGIVLATQNPVDLDYKGLSNIGTWFLGRLQTDRDKQRVLDGLEGAAAQSGEKFDRAKMEQTLAALGARVFLMNNVHEDEPVIFQSRWALSFLRGPLSRPQISELMKAKRDKVNSATEPARAPAASSSSTTSAATTPAPAAKPSSALDSSRPIVPGDVTEQFLAQKKFAARDSNLLYVPALFGRVAVHFVKSGGMNVDQWQDMNIIAPATSPISSDVWGKAFFIPAESIDASKSPDDAFTYQNLPIELAAARNYKPWQKDLQDWVYRTCKATIYFAPILNKYSRLGQSETDARIEFSQGLREIRDRKVTELESSYANKLQSLQNKVNDALAKLQKEQQDAQGHFWDSAVQIGTSVLGALVGRKMISQTNITRVSTAARKMSKTTGANAEVDRAQQRLEEFQSAYDQMNQECQKEVESLRREYEVESLRVEPNDIPVRKGDMQVEAVSLLWIPFERTASNDLLPLVDLPDAGAAAFGIRRRG